jgi:acyl-CoA synthetase (AMP-forming)/AMP-acid ligase II
MMGERVVTAAVSKQGHEIDSLDLQQHCKRHLHNWKCPKENLLVKELPRNTMVKVLKEEVKKFFEK